MTEKEPSKNAPRKAAAYMYSAVSYGPGDPNYPATREQSELIRAHAEKNDITIVKTYLDEGRHRKELENLLSDIHSGAVEYDLLLLSDITRWGRFYNVDEAARYEIACLHAGIEVRYVGEPFKDDGGIISTIFKTMKRIAMEECRRELAADAAAAHAENSKPMEKDGTHE